MRSGALSPFMAPPKRRQHQNSGRYQTKNGAWRDDFSGVMCIYRRRKTRKKRNFRFF
ncbi:hypothetical protein Hanom_Chr04g00350021 [Helianthus anomalus]